MSSLRVTPFEPGHLESLAGALHPFARDMLEASDLGLAELARRNAASGPAWTGWADGRPAVCAGLGLWSLRAAHRTAEAWAWLREGLPPALALPIVREVRRILPAAMDRYAVARCNAVVREDAALARRFARACGFAEEFTLRQWIDGTNYILCARYGNG